MKRATVLLGELKANPYKKDVRGGYIDPIVVEQIKESATKTSFWEQWVVRKNNRGEYELAFGHHRLQAAIDLYGEDYKVSVQVEDYDDEKMLIALANENAGKEETVEAQVDVIRITREYLRAHPDKCKFNPGTQCAGIDRTAAQLEADIEKAIKYHDHGSSRCLLEFLGDKNWDRRRIQTLVAIADRFDAALLKEVTNAETHPERQAAIGVMAAEQIAKLDKPSQRPVVQAIKTAQDDLCTFQKKEVAARKTKALPHSAIKDMSTHIPAAVVKQAVKKAAGLQPTKQGQAVVNYLKEEVERRKEQAILESVPDADSVVVKMVGNLLNFPPHDYMQELIVNRDLLSPLAKKNLLTALVRHIERVTEYRDELTAPPQRKLNA